MGIIETEGIVTREVKYGDSSRILTIITKDFGKISALAGGVRTNKSGLLSATQLFSYSSFTLFKGREKSLYKINTGEIISPFSSIRLSLEKMAYASYFCDITNFVVQEEAPEPEQVSLLLNTLYMLSEDKLPYEQIKSIFEFRTLGIFGMLPDISHCHHCNSVENLSYLNTAEGFALCDKCSKIHTSPAVYTGNGILQAISFIALADAKKIFAFSLPEKSLEYLSQMGEYFIETYLEHHFKTLDYLKKVTALSDIE